MSKLKIVTTLVASFFVLFLFANEAHATHFRYGNITYTIPDPINAPTTVRFDVVAGWRADAVDGTGFSATSLNFGDGQTNPSNEGLTIGQGVSASGEAYKVQRYSVTHTYAAPGTYTAFFTSCCRISTLVTGQHDTSFRIEAIVDLSTGNTGNAVSALPAIFQLQTGGVRTVAIPAADPDGVPVHCRFGTPGETLTTLMPAGIPANGVLPTLTDTPTGCTFSWNTAGGVDGNKFAVNIVLESNNGAVKSDAMLDFIIELTAAPPPSCTGGGLYNVDLGTTFQQNVVGTNVGGGNLKMTSIGTYGSLNPVPGTTLPSPFNTSYQVAPSIGDEGIGFTTIVYTNSSNLSGFCTMLVNTPQCPSFGNPCSVGVGACHSDGFMYCYNGADLCSAVEGQPQAEKCDMIDNNCDGQIDEGNPEAGLPCMSGLPGLCSSGTSLCNAGTLECIAAVTPGSVPETCDGVDQDCDGVVDNGFNVGQMCLKGNGQCLAAGKYVCDGNGGTTCDAQPGVPTPEVCDGKDNDCNQQIDDGFPLGQPCEVGVGACKVAGAYVCDANGGVKCDAVPGAPSTELCGNDIDEDCDDVLDNGCVDSDGDGVYDPEEVAMGLDPNDADSDDDGLLDGDEIQPFVDTDGDGLVNALDADSDDDGLFDGTEAGKACASPSTNPAAGTCIADADPSTTTNPLLKDTDAAGGSDGSEDFNLNGKVDADETDPNSPADDDKIVDTDGDGLSDGLEKTLGLNANDKDTDDDGLFDGLEPNPSCDTDGDGLKTCQDVDSDNDGLFDGTEAGKGCDDADTGANKQHCHFDGDPSTTTAVLSKDTDHGGMTDASEDANLNGVFGSKETNPNDAADDGAIMDSDGDGLSNELEAFLGSNPADADSDDDGVLDGMEANPSDDADGDGQPNILDADSDGDGLFDGTERGYDCSNQDTDATQNRCVADADGGQTKTVSLVADTDAGGVNDGDEDKNHDGAVNAGETDPNVATDDILPQCMSDADCGAANSGKVCDPDQQCVEGCRGAMGNGCPTGQVCSSMDDTIGTCMSGTGGAGGSTGGSGGEEPPPGGGCGCRTAGDANSGAFGLLAFAGLLAIAGARRRRR